jgi:hypothetical protein
MKHPNPMTVRIPETIWHMWKGGITGARASNKTCLTAGPKMALFKPNLINLTM